MAVSAVWRLIHLLAFIESKQDPYAHRRDASPIFRNLFLDP